jgi:hypothetical protein
LSATSGNSFLLKESEFINCAAGDGKSHAVYLNIASSSNEDFELDTITLTYTESTTESILYLRIYDLNGIVGTIDENRLNSFKSKFVGFCSSNPPNLTNAMVFDVSNTKQYSLSGLICDRVGIVTDIFLCKLFLC